jgi:hypothetical protein
MYLKGILGDMERREEMEVELSRILAKTMHSSYKRKEIEERIGRIFMKIEGVVDGKNERGFGPGDMSNCELEKLRKEFESIRRRFNDTSPVSPV